MAPKFSLNDMEIREIFDVARTSNNADVLRGMIYKLIKLRKEMAVSIHQLSSSRADLAAINESAAAALAMDKKQGLLALLDRKGFIAELQQQVSKQLQALTRLANEKAALQQELQSARGSNDGKAIIQSLRQEIASAEANLSQLTQQNQQVSAKANQLESNNQALNEKVRQLEALITDLRSQLSTAETLQKTAQAPQAEQAPVVAVQAPQSEAPQAEPNTFVRELFTQQIAALADKNMQLEQEVALVNEQNRTLSAQLQTAHEQIQQLTGELASLKESHKAEREASAQELLTASNKLEQLQVQLQEQISQIDRLTNQNSQLQVELQNSNATIGELKQEITAKDSEIQALTLNLNNDRERIETLQSILARTEGDLTSANEAIAKQDEENQQISSELEGLRSRLAEAISVSAANEEQLNAEIQALNESLRASLSRVEYLESDKVNLERNIQRLNDRTERLTGLKRQLQDSLRIISEDRQNLRQLASEVSLENTKTRKENSELQEICQAQSDELERLGSQLSLASKVIHLRQPVRSKDALIIEGTIESENDHSSETAGPSN